VYEARHERASLIQKYSREQARPGTDVGSNKIKLDPVQFMEYNCDYRGAKDWLSEKDMRIAVEKLRITGV
jgi:salicylate hydroxylase